MTQEAPVTEDEQKLIAATLTAHEHMIAFLLAKYVQRMSDDQRAEMTAAALAVLNDARFAEVFGPASRPEVAVAGGAGRLPPGLAIS